MGREFESPRPTLYSILNASTGLIDVARVAGITPAMVAAAASVAIAASITVTLTLVIS